MDYWGTLHGNWSDPVTTEKLWAGLLRNGLAQFMTSERWLGQGGQFWNWLGQDGWLQNRLGGHHWNPLVDIDKVVTGQLNRRLWNWLGGPNMVLACFQSGQPTWPSFEHLARLITKDIVYTVVTKFCMTNCQCKISYHIHERRRFSNKGGTQLINWLIGYLMHS